LIVPGPLADRVLGRLRAAGGVAHLAHHPDASLAPPGDVISCDVAREATNEIVEWLQELGIHRAGAISIEPLETVVSDAAAEAERAAPGHGIDALVWEEVEAYARDKSRITVSYLVFMSIASVIAGVGILVDSPVLVVGAMVVGPEYGPLAAACVSVLRGRPVPALRAVATLVSGLAVATVVTWLFTLVVRAWNIGPLPDDLSERTLTRFISHPDGLAAIVAVLAGIVGMLSLTQARSTTLVGVLVSVTTIPAAANLALAAAYTEWNELDGAAIQLAINLGGLVLGGVVTLAIQSWATTGNRIAHLGPPRDDADHPTA
jgi:uncharacterized hydrophobic protein (TIGR00271 family)